MSDTPSGCEGSLRFNSLGICHLQNGNYDDAIRSFKDGFQNLVRKLRTSRGDGGNTFIHDDLGSKTSGKGYQTSHIIYNTPLQEQYSFDNDSFAIFNHALELSEEACLLVEDGSEFFIRIATGVMLYNCALAHHIWGLQSGHSSHVVKALHLYQLSRSTFTDQTIECDHIDHLDLGLLAVINNTGNIYAHLHEHWEVCYCCEELSAVLATFSCERIPVSQEVLEIFFWNAATFHSLCPPTASAA